MTININGTTGISGVDGSAGTPAIQGSDTNTGVFFGTNTIDLSTDGTSRLSIGADGDLNVDSGTLFVDASTNRVGIGNTSPDQDLTIGDGSDNIIVNLKSGTSQFCLIDFGDTAGNAQGRIAYLNSDDAMTFRTGGSGEDVRIDSGGRLLVGTSSRINNEKALGVATGNQNGGTGVVHIRNTSSSSADTACCLVLSKTMTTTSSSARFLQFFANNTTTPMGGIVGNGASNVQFASISDIRDKENIEPLTGSLDKVKSLEVVSFDWKNTGEHVKAGFIAQNVETVFPEYVVDNMASEGQEARKGITGGLSSGYVAVLTAALQEAIAKIETLEARLSVLEGGAN